MATHEELYERAKKAIQDLFGDTSVDPAKTEESLKTLIHEIQDMLATLET